MSPYIRPSEARTLGESARCATRLPPILASIGTVLIDAFDSLPQPTVDDSPATSSRPASPVINEQAPQPQGHLQALVVPSRRLRLSPPLSSSAASGTLGPSTPQMTLDDIPVPNAEEIYEMLGGGALYALVGARFWLPPCQLRTLVDRAPAENDDCPKDVEQKLAKLGNEIWVWNRGEGTRMTRARIRYEGDVRYFQPVVKAPYRTIQELFTSPLLHAEYLHISPPYSPENVAVIISDLKALPKDSWRPKIVFEPTPPSCHPGQKDWLEKILPDIEVFSPNHEELFSFYSIPTMSTSSISLHPSVERLVTHILHNVGIGANGQGIVVVRCGRLGACVGTKEGGLKWCPAYWEGGDVRKVKDVTGAGNSFLGGYVAGLSLTNDPYEALLYGTVSSSFVVEQFGLPHLMDCTDPLTGEEIWNADIPSRRLKELKQRLGLI
ncbi:pfkB family carbohydrate kinase superfamily [Cryptococcus neoformans Tu401-1]|nr:pfkB family carbohydrate kinase superfamily [Cryptococcus neoformans var. grubii Bt85]OXG11785.1 pfkB family carbohydrate kinase superfamily [Cryptococcus neoformans var. grubii Tu401-1]OXM76306.1 pfkB family carbohydrate kinase superfamily [Cryptococcus neoformans var. grubii Bt63]